MEIQQEAVQSDLANYLPSLRERVVEAVAAYKAEYDAAVKRIHSKRSVASLIHDHIVHNMAHFAETTPGASLRNLRNLYILTFPEGYNIRFKKVGSDKLAAGWKTRQVTNFRTHQDLEGMPPGICLDLSYQLNVTGDLHAVYLICPSGVWSNMWEAELTDEGARPVVVSLFGEPTELEGATLLPKKKDVGNEAQSGDGDTGA